LIKCYRPSPKKEGKLFKLGDGLEKARRELLFSEYLFTAEAEDGTKIKVHYASTSSPASRLRLLLCRRLRLYLDPSLLRLHCRIGRRIGCRLPPHSHASILSRLGLGDGGCRLRFLIRGVSSACANPFDFNRLCF